MTAITMKGNWVGQPNAVVHGEDFPGKTLRVLKEKENKQFGEDWTRRLVLGVWVKMQG
jgi:hypothetical protein